MSDRILVDSSGRLGRITLRAGALNILGTQDVCALERAILELDACAVVLLCAENDRAFSAGMEVADHLPDRAPAMLEAVGRLANAFLGASPITVAKVGAPAIGGGFELVLLCDLAICSMRATFALPEITLAAMPPIGCGLLAQAVGTRRAADLMLTGRSIDAATAELWGIVCQAVPVEQLDEALRIYLGDLLPSPDAAEGINAFLERRKPVFGATHKTQEVAR
jgi:enoyl-CoA hydratase/carnithine racemase